MFGNVWSRVVRLYATCYRPVMPPNFHWLIIYRSWLWRGVGCSNAECVCVGGRNMGAWSDLNNACHVHVMSLHQEKKYQKLDTSYKLIRSGNALKTEVWAVNKPNELLAVTNGAFHLYWNFWIPNQKCQLECPRRWISTLESQRNLINPDSKIQDCCSAHQL